MPKEPKKDNVIAARLQKASDVCPFCNSHAFDVGSFDSDSDGCGNVEVTCHVTCNRCKAEWIEGYKFDWAVIKKQPSVNIVQQHKVEQ